MSDVIEKSRGTCACLGFIVVLLVLYVEFINKSRNINTIFSQHTSLSATKFDTNQATIDENTMHNDGNHIKSPMTIMFRFIFIMGLEGTGHHFMSELFNLLRTDKHNVLSKYFIDRPHSNDKRATPLCLPHENSSFAQGFIFKKRSKSSLYYGLKSDILYILKDKSHVSKIKKTIASNNMFDDDRNTNGNTNIDTNGKTTSANTNTDRNANTMTIDGSKDNNNYNYNPWPLIIMPKHYPSYHFCSVKKKMHPNIIEIFLLLKLIENEINNDKNLVDKKEFVIEFDLSVIVMYRSFINSLYSACTRFSSCNARINSFHDISLPMMMRQMYFFIKYINNDNHNNDNHNDNHVTYYSQSNITFNVNNTNYITNITQYRDYSNLDYYQKSLNDEIEQKFFNFVNTNKNINIDSAIKVLYYDKMLEYTNSWQVMPLAINLLQLLGIPTIEENIEAMVNSIFGTLHGWETGNGNSNGKSNSGINNNSDSGIIAKETIKKRAKVNSVGVDIARKWKFLGKIHGIENIIQEFYSGDLKRDKQLVIHNTTNFQSKLWTLFYIPQLSLN